MTAGYKVIKGGSAGARWRTMACRRTSAAATAIAANRNRTYSRVRTPCQARIIRAAQTRSCGGLDTSGYQDEREAELWQVTSWCNSRQPEWLSGAANHARN